MAKTKLDGNAERAAWYAPDMNPAVKYTFHSAKGTYVTIKTRMGEDAAREAAMKEVWGPPTGWCLNQGRGLVLTAKEEVV